MDLNYQIVRSPRRKKLTISVERDRSIVVHAPVSATDDAIGRVVESKRQWLFDKVNHPQKYQDRPHPPGKEVVNGESVPYLGRDYPVEISEMTFVTSKSTRVPRSLPDWISPIGC